MSQVATQEQATANHLWMLTALTHGVSKGQLWHDSNIPPPLLLAPHFDSKLTYADFDLHSLEPLKAGPCGNSVLSSNVYIPSFSQGKLDKLQHTLGLFHWQLHFFGWGSLRRCGMYYHCTLLVEHGKRAPVRFSPPQFYLSCWLSVAACKDLFLIIMACCKILYWTIIGNHFCL